MANVTGGTLMMAIQAVDDAVRELAGATADLESALPDDVDMLYCFDRAARELRAAYEIERLSTNNLPPYEQLVGGSGA